MSLIDHLSSRLNYLSAENVELVRQAYEFARAAHEGQFRKSGDPYITHPVAVANILADMRLDHQSLMAALMHDVIEDCKVSKAQMAERFGITVAELVDGVSKIGQIKFESKAEQQAENFRKMILAMTQDIRVILIKMADRLHNMRTLGHLAPEKRRRIARETLEIYAPIANRLGMHDFRTEFEDLGFQAMYPMRATRIKRAVKVARGNKKDTVNLIQEALTKVLDRDSLPGRVVNREKHLYSIYQKMRSKRRSFAQLMDSYSFRIIVDKVDTCYRVLGVVHNLYKPIPGRFKDYIAIPKANGYQSLHTTLKGMNGVPIDIQIRTEDMEAMANNGITAQWMFRSEKNITNTAQSRAREWMKSLLEIQQHAGNSLEFIESVKTDLFPDEVYVFTPKGRIMGLPMGATAIDFAYAVHTDVGNTCVAARVDNRLAPLSVPIQSGQTVQIITAPGASPNPAWLNFVITAKARSNIRHFLKHQQRSQSVELGRRLLDKVLHDLETSIDKLPEKSIKRALHDSNFKTLDDLYEDIGLGNRMAQVVAHQLAFDRSSKVQELDSADVSPLAIRGTEGLVVNYAKCCRPVPGDSIVGHLSSGRGVVIHRASCKNMLVESRDYPEKCIPLTWATEIKGDFPVDLRVEIENQRGILATVASTLTEADAVVESINLKEMDGRLSVIKLRICVKDRISLARAIKRIRTLKGVSKISRIKN